MQKPSSHISYNFARKAWNYNVHQSMEIPKLDHMHAMKAKFEEEFPSLELIEIRSMQSAEELPGLRVRNPHLKNPKPSEKGIYVAIQLIYKNKKTGFEGVGSWVFLNDRGSAMGCAAPCAGDCKDCAVTGLDCACWHMAGLAFGSEDNCDKSDEAACKKCAHAKAVATINALQISAVNANNK